MTTTTRGSKTASGRQAPAGITIVSNRLRSTNLDRDARGSDLDPLQVGIRAQDMLDRVAAALEDPTRTRAWSLTGPYGSGKSTLALITIALLGRDSTRRSEADTLLADASPALAARFAAARDNLVPDGLITCVTTARQEPLIDTIGRAVRDGVEHGWGAGKPPKAVLDAVSVIEPGVGAGTIINAVRQLCSHAPVLLVIDELGKSLEHLASRGEFADAASDVFLLQELAEIGAGSRGLPLYLITLQHLAFADYASRSTALQTREWAKIQGRFEDIMMTPHLGDAVDLMRQTLDHTGVSAKGRKLIDAHAAASREAWATRGLEGILPADQAMFADLYPLHPLTTVVAPLLSTQVGQHDRSMTGFIANDEPHTVRRFLENFSSGTATSASTVRLADVYDYFFTAGRTTVLASTNAGRWMEIDSRISDGSRLPDEDQAILKTIGLLNLVDSAGALRASMDTILFALCDPTGIDNATTRTELDRRVKELCTSGFIVYRDFSDEYRVWQGSDVDLTGNIEQLINDCDDHTAVSVAAEYLPTAVVAGKHSQRTGMLRHFVTKATDAYTTALTGPADDDAADGLLIFHFGDEDTIPPVRTNRPVIVGVTSEAKGVLNAARYLHALLELPDHIVLDATASREASERAAQAGAELATRVTEAFAPSQLHPRWHLLPNNGGIAQYAGGRPTEGARSLAALVSGACEAVFPEAPHIRNEMLGRHTLTSQGARARRELLLAMINAPTRQYLGIQGYGPERAMYSGVLEYLGLHRPTPGHDHDGVATYGFSEPDRDTSLYPAWVALRERLWAASDQPVGLDTVFDMLEAPPYGIRPGVIPIIVLTALIIGSQEYAVFEERTYQTRLTEAVVERLLKNPERFGVKAMGAQTGPRKSAIVEIAEQLGTRVPPHPPVNARNVAPLAITRDLLDRARTLTAYADRTQNLSNHARAVRAALKDAREPDALLFTDLPDALGLPPIPVRGRIDTTATRTYAESLGTALAEIATADQRLREQVIDAVADAFHLPNTLPKLRRQLAAMTKPLGGLTLTEPRLRGVITLAHDDMLSDEDWVDPFVVRISGRGLSDWRDGDLTAFVTEVKAVARSIERLTHLHQPTTPPQAGDTFVARVLTLTRADGHEEHAVIHVADADAARVQSIAADAVTAARKALGSHGDRILLAILAETVLGDQDTEAAAVPRPRKKPNR